MPETSLTDKSDYTQYERDEFHEKVEKIAKKHESKILDWLNELVDGLQEEGIPAERPYDLHDGTSFKWVVVCPYHESEDPTDEKLWVNPDIMFEIHESPEFDGTLEGITFMISMTENGGSTIGGFSPYNFTDEVWVDVDNADAIENRLNLLLDDDIQNSVIYAIDQHYHENK